MPTLTITKTYDDGQVLNESDLDAIKSSIETFINSTKFDSDNIQISAIANDVFDAITMTSTRADSVADAMSSDGADAIASTLSETGADTILGAVSQTAIDALTADIDVSNFTTGTVSNDRLNAASDSTAGVVKLDDSFDTNATDTAAATNLTNTLYKIVTQQTTVTGDASVAAWVAHLYTGTSSSETNFPVGHMISVEGPGDVTRNSSTTLRLDGNNNYSYRADGSGSTLSGTWRARGRIGPDTLFQRVT